MLLKRARHQGKPYAAPLVEQMDVFLQIRRAFEYHQ
jgi:hypothetical protein